jgi:hypothetical protein
MADYQTTMKDLVSNIKTLLSSKTGSGLALEGIRQVKRGILPQNNQFPLITLIPDRELLPSLSSSGLVRIERTVSVFVFGQIHRPDDVFNVQKYADVAMETLRDNQTIPDSDGDPTVIAVEFTPITIDESRGGAVFSVTCTSEETLSRTTAPTIENNPTSKEVLDKIYTKLNDLVPTASNKIRAVFREEWDTGWARLLPSVTCQLTGHEQASRASGRDHPEMSFDVNLYSKVASAADSTLLTHLDAAEVIKVALTSEANWDGKCHNSALTSINYGQRLESNELLYQTTFDVLTTTRHNI